MNTKTNEDRANAYLEEAALSLESAKSIFNEATKTGKQLWAHVVKIAYDGMEQAISSALSAKGFAIPKEHPAKISSFLNNYKPGAKTESILLFWLRKRSKSQYVDIIEETISVPHKIFNESDAEKAIGDCKFIINFIKQLISK